MTELEKLWSLIVGAPAVSGFVMWLLAHRLGVADVLKNGHIIRKIETVDPQAVQQIHVLEANFEQAVKDEVEKRLGLHQTVQIPAVAPESIKLPTAPQDESAAAPVAVPLPVPAQLMGLQQSTWTQGQAAAQA